MIKYMHALPLLFKHHLASHIFSIRGALLTTVAMLLVGFVSSSFFIEMGLDQQLEERSVAGRTTIGFVWAKKILDHISSNQKGSESQPSKALQGTSFVIQGSASLADVQALSKLLHQVGMVKATRQNADVVFDWSDGSWVMSTTQPHISSIVWSVLFQQMASNRKEVQKQVDDVKDAWVPMVLDQKLPEGLNKYGARLIMSYMLVLAPMMFWFTFASSLSAVNTDQRRQSGILEPFALSPAPIWVYFVSQSCVSAVSSTLIFAIILCVAGLFIDFVSWSAVPLILLMFWMVVFTLSLVGVAQVMVIHHKYARAIGSIVFSPVFPTLMLLFLLDPLTHLLTGHAQSVVDGKRILPIVDWSVSHALGTMAFLVPTCVVSVVGLCAFIEWRAGRRRTALCKI